MELLEGVNQGWGRGDVAEFLIAKRIKNGDLAAWLRRFEARLLAGAQGSTAPTDAVVSLQELARRLELLSGIAIGKLGECAGNVGREILVEFSLASVEGVEVGERSAEAWCDRGIVQCQNGDFEGAIASFDQALEFKPNKHEAWYNRGVALGKLERLEEAIASWDKALKFKQHDREAWFNRGNALYNLGRLEDAIASWDKALEIKPDYHLASKNRTIALKKLGIV
jgi:tetratricopeptide (TPR) repeat protein